MIAYNQKYCVFDFETEGLNLKYSRPWELSYLIAQGNKVLSQEQLYIDLSDFNLSKEVRELTSFNDEKYNSKKTIPENAFEKFSKIINDPQYILVGQNLLKFDVYMLKVLADICNKSLDFSFMDRILDTRPLALAYREGLQKPKNDSMLEWQSKIINDRTIKSKASQLTLLKLFGIEFEKEKLHDGLYDCQMTWQIFLQLKKVLSL
jgi:DNA polymerase III alpha subunit (gram-positive type)